MKEDDLEIDVDLLRPSRVLKVGIPKISKWRCSEIGDGEPNSDQF